MQPERRLLRAGRRGAEQQGGRGKRAQGERAAAAVDRHGGTFLKGSGGCDRYRGGREPFQAPAVPRRARIAGLAVC
ncbi:hypothetical protein GCM10009416_30030 [Craurococcus roseus]|uniref:Uncharacterized protein n=1 Tax=Craurococcus roseus TaxID=77585 RepID=A0ABP3QIF0_9PROT